MADDAQVSSNDIPPALRQTRASKILTEAFYNSMSTLSRALMLAHLAPILCSALPSERMALS